MDPNTLLLSLRNLVRDFEAGKLSNQDAASALADGFADLDEWLAKGGFLPDRWINNFTVI